MMGLEKRREESRSIAEAAEGLACLRESIARLTRGPNILIVDDSRNDVFILEKTVREASPRSNIECAFTCESGLAMFSRQAHDAVLLDLSMAGMGGIGFLKQICRPNVVVIVTGHDVTAPEVLEALKLGAVMAIQKPVQADDLRRIFGGVHG